jgi:sporulation protein YlmC with PRC-barrel domain
VNIDELVGKKVICEKAITLGEVRGAEADTNNWTITHLLVKLTKEATNELEFKKRFGSPTVSMPVSLIKAVGDVITIQKPISELSKTRELVEYKE